MFEKYNYIHVFIATVHDHTDGAVDTKMRCKINNYWGNERRGELIVSEISVLTV